MKITLVCGPIFIYLFLKQVTSEIQNCCNHFGLNRVFWLLSFFSWLFIIILSFSKPSGLPRSYGSHQPSSDGRPAFPWTPWSCSCPSKKPGWWKGWVASTTSWSRYLPRVFWDDSCSNNGKYLSRGIKTKKRGNLFIYFSLSCSLLGFKLPHTSTWPNSLRAESQRDGHQCPGAVGGISRWGINTSDRNYKRERS